MHQSANEGIDLSLSGPSMERELLNWICVPPNLKVQANKADGEHNTRTHALIRH